MCYIQLNGFWSSDLHNQPYMLDMRAAFVQGILFGVFSLVASVEV